MSFIASTTFVPVSHSTLGAAVAPTIAPAPAAAAGGGGGVLLAFGGGGGGGGAGISPPHQHNQLSSHTRGNSGTPPASTTLPVPVYSLMLARMYQFAAIQIQRDMRSSPNLPRDVVQGVRVPVSVLEQAWRGGGSHLCSDSGEYANWHAFWSKFQAVCGKHVIVHYSGAGPQHAHVSLTDRGEVFIERRLSLSQRLATDKPLSTLANWLAAAADLRPVPVSFHANYVYTSLAECPYGRHPGASETIQISLSAPGGPQQVASVPAARLLFTRALRLAFTATAQQGRGVVAPVCTHFILEGQCKFGEACSSCHVVSLAGAEFGYPKKYSPATSAESMGMVGQAVNDGVPPEMMQTTAGVRGRSPVSAMPPPAYPRPGGGSGNSASGGGAVVAPRATPIVATPLQQHQSAFPTTAAQKQQLAALISSDDDREEELLLADCDNVAELKKGLSRAVDTKKKLRAQLREALQQNEILRAKKNKQNDSTNDLKSRMRHVVDAISDIVNPKN